MIAFVALLVSASPVAASPTIAEPFRAYYAQHEGLRILGAPLSELLHINGTPAQYFEKGRLEDHRGDVSDPQWVFMYGRLTAELMVDAPARAVNSTNVTYDELRLAAEPALRTSAAINFLRVRNQYRMAYSYHTIRNSVRHQAM